MDGVVQTRQGWIGKEEVVEVDYDPKVVTLESLIAFGRANGNARNLWVRDASQQEEAKQAYDKDVPLYAAQLRLDKEQKYYLLQSPLRALGMSEAQACRVNATLEGDWRRWLTPEQVRRAEVLLQPEAESSE